MTGESIHNNTFSVLAAEEVLPDEAYVSPGCCVVGTRDLTLNGDKNQNIHIYTVNFSSKNFKKKANKFVAVLLERMNKKSRADLLMKRYIFRRRLRVKLRYTISDFKSIRAAYKMNNFELVRVYMKQLMDTWIDLHQPLLWLSLITSLKSHIDKRLAINKQLNSVDHFSKDVENVYRFINRNAVISNNIVYRFEKRIVYENLVDEYKEKCYQQKIKLIQLMYKTRFQIYILKKYSAIIIQNWYRKTARTCTCYGSKRKQPFKPSGYDERMKQHKITHKFVSKAAQDKIYKEAKLDHELYAESMIKYRRSIRLQPYNSWCYRHKFMLQIWINNLKPNEVVYPVCCGSVEQMEDNNCNCGYLQYKSVKPVDGKYIYNRHHKYIKILRHHSVMKHVNRTRNFPVKDAHATITNTFSMSEHKKQRRRLAAIRKDIIRVHESAQVIKLKQFAKQGNKAAMTKLKELVSKRTNEIMTDTAFHVEQIKHKNRIQEVAKLTSMSREDKLISKLLRTKPLLVARTIERKQVTLKFSKWDYTGPMGSPAGNVYLCGNMTGNRWIALGDKGKQHGGFSIPKYPCDQEMFEYTFLPTSDIEEYEYIILDSCSYGTTWLDGHWWNPRFRMGTQSRSLNHDVWLFPGGGFALSGDYAVSASVHCPLETIDIYHTPSLQTLVGIDIDENHGPSQLLPKELAEVVTADIVTNKLEFTAESNSFRMTVVKHDIDLMSILKDLNMENEDFKACYRACVDYILTSLHKHEIIGILRYTIENCCPPWIDSTSYNYSHAYAYSTLFEDLRNMNIWAAIHCASIRNIVSRKNLTVQIQTGNTVATLCEGKVLVDFTCLINNCVTITLINESIFLSTGGRVSLKIHDGQISNNILMKHEPKKFLSCFDIKPLMVPDDLASKLVSFSYMHMDYMIHDVFDIEHEIDTRNDNTCINIAKILSCTMGVTDVNTFRYTNIMSAKPVSGDYAMANCVHGAQLTTYIGQINNEPQLADCHCEVNSQTFTSESIINISNFVLMLITKTYDYKIDKSVLAVAGHGKTYSAAKDDAIPNSLYIAPSQEAVNDFNEYLELHGTGKGVLTMTQAKFIRNLMQGMYTDIIRIMIDESTKYVIKMIGFIRLYLPSVEIYTYGDTSQNRFKLQIRESQGMQNWKICSMEVEIQCDTRRFGEGIAKPLREHLDYEVYGDPTITSTMGLIKTVAALRASTDVTVITVGRDAEAYYSQYIPSDVEVINDSKAQGITRNNIIICVNKVSFSILKNKQNWIMLLTRARLNTRLIIRNYDDTLENFLKAISLCSAKANSPIVCRPTKDFEIRVAEDETSVKDVVDQVVQESVGTTERDFRAIIDVVKQGTVQNFAIDTVTDMVANLMKTEVIESLCLSTRLDEQSYISVTKPPGYSTYTPVANLTPKLIRIMPSTFDMNIKDVVQSLNIVASIQTNYAIGYTTKATNMDSLIENSENMALLNTCNTVLERDSLVIPKYAVYAFTMQDKAAELTASIKYAFPRSLTVYYQQIIEWAATLSALSIANFASSVTSLIGTLTAVMTGGLGAIIAVSLVNGLKDVALQTAVKTGFHALTSVDMESKQNVMNYITSTSYAKEKTYLRNLQIKSNKLQLSMLGPEQTENCIFMTLNEFRNLQSQARSHLKSLSMFENITAGLDNYHRKYKNVDRLSKYEIEFALWMQNESRNILPAWTTIPVKDLYNKDTGLIKAMKGAKAIFGDFKAAIAENPFDGPITIAKKIITNSDDELPIIVTWYGESSKMKDMEAEVAMLRELVMSAGHDGDMQTKVETRGNVAVYLWFIKFGSTWDVLNTRGKLHTTYKVFRTLISGFKKLKLITWSPSRIIGEQVPAMITIAHNINSLYAIANESKSLNTFRPILENSKIVDPYANYFTNAANLEVEYRQLDVQSVLDAVNNKYQVALGIDDGCESYLKNKKVIDDVVLAYYTDENGNRKYFGKNKDTSIFYSKVLDHISIPKKNMIIYQTELIEITKELSKVVESKIYETYHVVTHYNEDGSVYYSVGSRDWMYSNEEINKMIKSMFYIEFKLLGAKGDFTKYKVIKMCEDDSIDIAAISKKVPFSDPHIIIEVTKVDTMLLKASKLKPLCGIPTKDEYREKEKQMIENNLLSIA